MAFVMLKKLARVSSLISRTTCLSFRTGSSVTSSFSKQISASIYGGNSSSVKRCLTIYPRSLSTSSSFFINTAAATSNNTKTWSQPRKKEEILRIFYEKLSAGELFREWPYHILRACGPSLHLESRESKNEIITHIWNEMEKNDVMFETPLWNQLIRLRILNRYDFEPHEYLEKIKDSGSEPNLSTYELLSKAYAVKGDADGVMKMRELINENHNFGEPIRELGFADLITLYGKKGDTEGLKNTFESMREHGISPSCRTYGCLLDTYAYEGDLESIEKTLDEMATKNIEPTEGIYVGIIQNLLRGEHHNDIEIFCQHLDKFRLLSYCLDRVLLERIVEGDYKGAFTLLKNMYKPSGSENGFFYYLQVKMFERMLFLNRDMSEFMKATSATAKYCPQPFSSNMPVLMQFLCRSTGTDNALHVIDSLIADKKKLSVYMFRPLVKSFAENGDKKALIHIRDKMKDNGVYVDYFCYRFMDSVLNDKTLEQPDINSYKAFGSLSSTSKELVTNVENASPAELFFCKEAIKGVLKKDFVVPDAIEVLKTMFEKGVWDVDLVTENLMNYFSRNNTINFVGAHQLVKGLLMKEQPITLRTYKYLLQMVETSKHLLEAILTMKTYNVELDDFRNYDVMRLAARYGHASSAQYYFDKIKKNNQFDIQYPYSTLIQAYSNAQNLDSTSMEVTDKVHTAESIIKIYEEMQAANYVPTEKTIYMIASSYLSIGDTKASEAVLENYNQYLSPNESSEIIFMKSYVRSGNVEAAEELFKKIKENSTAVKASVYNGMINLYANLDPVKMEEYYNQMLEDGIEPTYVTHKNRLFGYLIHYKTEPERCVPILEETFTSKPLFQRINMLMKVLRALVNNGDVENVQKVVGMVRKYYEKEVSQPRLDQALVMVHLKRGDIEVAAEELFGENAVQSQKVALNQFRQFARNASLEGDVEFIENMKRFLTKYKLNDRVVDVSLLIAYDKSDNIEGIRELCHQRKLEGFASIGVFLKTLTEIAEHRNLPDLVEETDKEATQI